jgi:hypothetical protein
MEDPQEWLDKNTFYCPKIRGKLTLANCQDNRKRFTKEDVDMAVSNGVSLGTKPMPCTSCKDWKELNKRVGMSKEDEEKYKDILHPKRKKLFS